MGRPAPKIRQARQRRTLFLWATREAPEIRRTPEQTKADDVRGDTYWIGGWERAVGSRIQSQDEADLMNQSKDREQKDRI